MAIVKYPEVSRTWESLEGKPEIVVSSKGIANGLSDTTNGGGDFGVDTFANLLVFSITLTNSQSTATPAPFQQLITFNPAGYSKYLATDLGNIRFFADSNLTQPLYSWVESGNKTASSANIWVKLPNGVGANSSVTIYMWFEEVTVEFDGVYAGQAPQLSATYGAYDNGALVFNFYSNFAGTSLPSGWTVSGVSYTVNNGISVGATTEGTKGTLLTTNAIFNAPEILDIYGTQNYDTTTYQGMGALYVTSSVNSGTFFYTSGGSSINTQQTTSSGASTQDITSVGTAPLTAIYTIQATSTTSNYFVNYGDEQTISSNAPTYPLQVGILTAITAQDSITWIRTRTYPSNGVNLSYTKNLSFTIDSVTLTQTRGIQEAVNYVFIKGGGRIQLDSGMFDMDMSYVNEISQTANAHVIEVPQNSISNPIITIEIDGVMGVNSDYQTGYNATPSITPTTPNNGSTIYLPELLTASPVGGTAIFGSAVPPTENANAGLNNNVNIILRNVTIMNQAPSSSGYQFGAWQLDNFAGFDIDGVVATVYTPTGALVNPLTASSGQLGITVNPPHNGNGMARIRSAYVVNYQYGTVFSFGSNEVQHLHVDYLLAQYCTYGVTIGNVGNYPPVIDIMDLEQNQYPIVFNNSAPIQFYFGRAQIQNQGAYSSTNWSNAEYDIWFNNSADVYGDIELYITGGSIADNPLVGGNTQYNQLNIRQITGAGSIALFPRNLPTPTISANPPVSGTVYQNTNPYTIEIDLPVYATTSGTAGYVTLAKGTTSTPTAIANQFVNGSTSSTSTEILRLIVPAGWYYSFTASGITFGTATVFSG